MSKDNTPSIKDKLKELIDQEARNAKGPETSNIRSKLDQYLEALVSEVEKN